MKICPVCSETFADDLKFCELDGTRLARLAGATGEASHPRTWSLLGIGLLVGALVLSAVSVFWIPRTRQLPAASSSPVTNTAPPPMSSSKPAESSGSSIPPAGATATSDQPDIAVGDVPPADATARKKDRTKTATADDSAPKLNPKAAAQTGDDTAKLDPPVVQPAPPPRKVEPAPTPKAASEARAPDATPKAAATADPKKDSRHTKDAASDDKKKADDKDKKKGGFFRVFKKIFGKD